MLRIVLWALGALAVVVIVGGASLQVAVWRNGPAVLDRLDRLTSSATGARRLALLSTGDHPAQKVIFWGPDNGAIDGGGGSTGDRMGDGQGRPVLLFAHGGSWRSGDPEDYGFVARAFVPEGFIVVLAGYRLVKEGAGDGVYPAMIEDTAKAIATTRAAVARYGGDPNRIVVMGHSAGAYNVVMAALERRWLADLGENADALRGVIGISGPYDFYPFARESTIGAFGQASDPEATQVFNHVRSDAPPILLIHGEKDTLVRPRNSRDLAALIDTAGGRAALKLYPEMGHNDPLIALASPWRKRREVARAIARFAKKVTAP